MINNNNKDATQRGLKNPSLAAFTMLELVFTVGIISIISNIVNVKYKDVKCNAKNKASFTMTRDLMYEWQFNPSVNIAQELLDRYEAGGQQLFMNHCLASDLNGDGELNGDDIDVFIKLTEMDGDWATCFSCDDAPEKLASLMDKILTGNLYFFDYNRDGSFDYGDIDGFTKCYLNPSECVLIW